MTAVTTSSSQSVRRAFTCCFVARTRAPASCLTIIDPLHQPKLRHSRRRPSYQMRSVSAVVPCSRLTVIHAGRGPPMTDSGDECLAGWACVGVFAFMGEARGNTRRSDAWTDPPL